MRNRERLIRLSRNADEIERDEVEDADQRRPLVTGIGNRRRESEGVGQ